VRRTILLALCWLSAGAGASAYLTFGVPAGGRTVVVRWPQDELRYFLTDRDAPGVSAGEMRAAIERAAARWQAVPTARVALSFVGFTGRSPSEEDGLSTLGFEHRPDLDQTLGVTSFLVDETTGEILESDVLFNTAFAWSVAAAGEPGRFDLESIAVHELGHFMGLGHSALGETEVRPGGGRRVLAAGTVMFPIAFSPGTTSGRSLHADDVAGVSDLYPGGGFEEATGSLSGTVTLDGLGILGAHVIAFHLESGRLVGGFSVNADGQFSIGGLEPGPHLVRVEPLDDVNEGDVFDEDAAVETNFAVTAHDRIVVVPQGGSASVDIEVVPR
jgi:hypothetical protein